MHRVLELAPLGGELDGLVRLQSAHLILVLAGSRSDAASLLLDLSLPDFIHLCYGAMRCAVFSTRSLPMPATDTYFQSDHALHKRDSENHDAGVHADAAHAHVCAI